MRARGQHAHVSRALSFERRLWAALRGSELRSTRIIQVDSSVVQGISRCSNQLRQLSGCTEERPARLSLRECHKRSISQMS